MKAIVCTTLGGPELLQFQEVPSAALRPREVRVAVKSAGVNFPDSLQIAGKYQMKLNPPFTPGAEIAGVVTEIGASVTRLKVGDTIAAFVPFGGYASECVVAADMALPLPPAFDPADAGGFPLVYGTTLHALKQRGQLKAGETLLIQGGSSGIGLAGAIELARAGARVVQAHEMGSGARLAFGCPQDVARVAVAMQAQTLDRLHIVLVWTLGPRQTSIASY